MNDHPRTSSSKAGATSRRLPGTDSAVTPFRYRRTYTGPIRSAIVSTT